MSFPADLELSRRTKSFDAETTPKALLEEHDTKAGVWGAIVVERGSLLFTDCRKADAPRRLGVGRHEVIEPQVRHFVEPGVECVFHVELWRRASAD